MAQYANKRFVDLIHARVCLLCNCVNKISMYHKHCRNKETHVCSCVNPESTKNSK